MNDGESRAWPVTDLRHQLAHGLVQFDQLAVGIHGVAAWLASLPGASRKREALRLGDTLARRLPRGYATLQDQLRRALLSAYLGIAEASSRQGADRLCRFRCARGEACEAAAALEGVLVLNLAPEGEILALLALLDRLCAMLTRLGRMGDSSGEATDPGQRGRER